MNINSSYDYLIVQKIKKKKLVYCRKKEFQKKKLLKSRDWNCKPLVLETVAKFEGIDWSLVSLWRIWLVRWSKAAYWHIKGHKFRKVYWSLTIDCFVGEEKNLKINKYKIRVMWSFLVPVENWAAEFWSVEFYDSVHAII